MRKWAECRWLVLAMLAMCWGLSGDVSVAEETGDDAGPSSPLLTKKWLVLHTPVMVKGASGALPEDGPLVSLDVLDFEGPKPGHPFTLGMFSADGAWGLEQGIVQPIEGEETALKIITAENFELEGMMNAQGLGGWFFIVGWNEGDGYCVHNVEMKQSGSPWGYHRMIDGKPAPGMHGELSRFSWKGFQPFWLSVVDGKLNLRVGTQDIAKELTLTDYSGGDVIFGTYKTKYGAKPVRIQSLRIRAR